MNKFNDYIKNKSVILVGPSESLYNNKTGEFIDNFDIVCRIKKSFPLNKKQFKYTGKRTDILISHFKFGTKIYKQNNFNDHDVSIFNKNLKYIIFPFPHAVQPFSKFFKNFHKTDFCKNMTVPIVYKENKEQLEYLKKNLNDYDPKTGLMSINFLLSCDIKKLYITGMTFEKDGFNKLYKSKQDDEYCRERTKKVHNSDLELEYFKKLCSEDKRIEYDIELSKLLNK